MLSTDTMEREEYNEKLMKKYARIHTASDDRAAAKPAREMFNPVKGFTSAINPNIKVSQSIN